MIDKSIRQHYQTGEKVGPFRKGIEIIMPKIKEQIKSQVLPQEGKKLPNIIKAPLQKAALSKLGLGALNPVLGLLSLLGIDPMAWLGGKMTQGGALQAFQTGFGSPQEGRELRQLESRRANMLQRKEEGKNYSEKNLDMVTRAIAEAKGLDINNPNEMRNIDKPIQQIRIEKRVTEPSRVIPKTPEIISPHLLGGDETITPPKISPISYEDDFATETIADIKAKEAEAAAIKQQEAFEAQRREAELQREVTRQAEANAARIRAEQARAAGPHGNGGGGGHHGHTETRSSSGWESSPFKKGGRVDKALGGRVRDI